MNDQKFARLLVAINSAIPLVLLIIDGFRGALGANPIEYVLRATGVLTLVFIGLTLLITPLRSITGRNSLIKYRRELGLVAFAYASTHFIVYFFFDTSGSISDAILDALRRPFIFIGISAYIMMIPLAVTSTNSMIKRLGGKDWARLHRLVYPVAIFGVIHFWMIVKSDVFYPAIAALMLAFLLGWRIFAAYKKRNRNKTN